MGKTEMEVHLYTKPLLWDSLRLLEFSFKTVQM